MGLFALNRIQVGLETVPGTALAATAKLMGMSLGKNLKDREVVQPTDERGSLAAAHRSYIPFYLWEDKIEGAVTFEDLPYILGMAIKASPAGSVVDTSAYSYTYTPSVTAANTPDTRTLEFGDDTQAYEAEYVFAKSLEIGAALDETLRFSADLVGRQLSTTTFTGALSNRSVEDALAAKTILYMDDTGGTLGSTAKTDTLLDWTWRLPAHFVPKRHQDGSLLFSAFSEVAMQPELELVAEFTSGVATLRSKYTAGTRQLVRLRTTGSLVGAVSATKQLTIDGAYTITEFGSLEERNGTNIVRMKLMGEYDTAAALLFSIVCQNGATAIA